MEIWHLNLSELTESEDYAFTNLSRLEEFILSLNPPTTSIREWFDTFKDMVDGAKYVYRLRSVQLIASKLKVV